MSRQSEKFFKEIEKALKDNPGAIDDKEQMDSIIKSINEHSEQIMYETDVFDYLEMAENAPTEKKALEYIKKALALEPDNTDALTMQAEISCKTPEKLGEKYCELIKQAEKKLADEGYFDEENIGDFWFITETRPYMRLLGSLAELYTKCGKMHRAAEIYEKMLRLCTGDNLGVRYILMHIYAFFEDENAAVSLFEKYPDEGTQFLLPMSALYYKLGDLKKAEKYLSQLCEVNKDTYKFFHSAVSGTESKGLSESGFGCRPDTIDELMVEMRTNSYLFLTTAGFFPWAEKACKPAKTSKSAGSKPVRKKKTKSGED